MQFNKFYFQNILKTTIIIKEVIKMPHNRDWMRHFFCYKFLKLIKYFP